MNRVLQLAARCAARTELTTSLHSASDSACRGAQQNQCAQSAYRWYRASNCSKAGARDGFKNGDNLSSEGQRLFGKVLEGQHVPPVDTTAAAAPNNSTSGRILNAVSNVLFYGFLAGGAAFAGSYYAYTDEELAAAVANRQLATAGATAGGAGVSTSGSSAAARTAAGVAGTSSRTSGISGGSGGSSSAGSEVAAHLHRDSSPGDSDAQDAVEAVKHFALKQLHSIRAWFAQKQTEFSDPPTDELLPDMHPFQLQHNVRTLVLDLDGVLVHSEWSRQVGWKTFKRPGATDLLEVLGQFYEIVVFTNESHSYADPILNRIDPGMVQGEGPVISYRLYKNSTQYRDGEHCRDLSKLNRDLSKVLFVTSKKREKTCMQPENTIVIDDWTNMDPSDTTLLDLVPMLQLIVLRQVPDTRTVCASYQGKDVVTTFRERMQSTAASAEGAAEKPRRRSMFSR